MEWPFGPYETVMGAILLLTIPIQRILTRDEPEMRVALSDILGEIKENLRKTRNILEFQGQIS